MAAHNCSNVAEQDITRALRDSEPVQTGCDLVRRRLGGARLLLELDQLHRLAVQRQVKCLHSYNDRSIVYTHTMTGQLFTLVQRQVNCSHSNKDRSSVFTLTTTGQWLTLVQQQVRYLHSQQQVECLHSYNNRVQLQVKCLHSYNDRSNVYTHTKTSINFNTQDYIQK